VYLDNADAAGALGYHDITKDGQPVCKVFVETTIAAHELVSVTASHELFEMVIDPVANLWAQGGDRTEYAYEMCDPVEEDTSWWTGSRCQISCIQLGLSRLRIRLAPNSITLVYLKGRSV
jgi:hypothetical protein